MRFQSVCAVFIRRFILNETNSWLVRPIAYIHTDFTEKFGIPRQSGRVPSLTGQIVFAPEYRNPDALRGIEQFTHLWLLFDFSESHRADWSPTVRPPRLGGNTRVGVFASRSPFRPNPIGLSCVRLIEVCRTKTDGLTLLVGGVDLLDGTPILDIKPYLPYADCIPQASAGYTQSTWAHHLDVQMDPSLLARIPPEKRETILACLREDPRPSYQEDPERIYGMQFAGLNIQFQVSDNILTVIRIDDK